MLVEIVYRPVYDLFQFGYGGLSRSHGSTDCLDHVEHRVPSSLQTCTINQSPLMMKWEKFFRMHELVLADRSSAEEHLR